jgi:protein-disulfide isomerase
MIWVGLSSAEVKRFQIPLENSPVIGSETAAVTIVEFIDYQ